MLLAQGHLPVQQSVQNQGGLLQTHLPQKHLLVQSLVQKQGGLPQMPLAQGHVLVQNLVQNQGGRLQVPLAQGQMLVQIGAQEFLQLPAAHALHQALTSACIISHDTASRYGAAHLLLCRLRRGWSQAG